MISPEEQPRPERRVEMRTRSLALTSITNLLTRGSLGRDMVDRGSGADNGCHWCNERKKGRQVNSTQAKSRGKVG